MRSILPLLLFFSVVAFAADDLPPVPDGVNKDRVAAFQAAVKAGDGAVIGQTFAAIHADFRAAKGAPDQAAQQAALNTEEKYDKQWRAAYINAKQKAADQGAADQEAANVKAEADAAKQAEDAKAAKAQQDKDAKDQLNAAGGFSDKDPDMNTMAADIRKGIAAFLAEDDIDKGIAAMGQLNDSMVNLHHRVCAFDGVSETDFAAYDKIKGEYTDAIATKTKGDGIKAARYIGVAKDDLQALADKEAFDKDLLVEHIVQVDVNAYGKFFRDIKTIPSNEKDVSDGYKEARWTMPFKHDALPAGEPEIIFLKMKNSRAPAIVVNPKVDGGYLHWGTLFINPRIDALNVETKRLDDGPDAVAVWNLALKLSKGDDFSEVSQWPAVVTSTPGQSRPVQ